MRQQKISNLLICNMEIHERYYSNSSQETTPTTSSIPETSNSDKMFALIKMNRVTDILPLFQATPRGELYRLVNTRNPKFSDMLPINYAIMCSASHLILVMLLRLGARYDDSTESPLLVAVRAGLMNLVKILVISGADVNVLDKDGFSVLHWASFRRNILMARTILKLSDFHFHNHDRNTKRISPLGVAVEQNNYELVKELLKCPRVDANIIDTTSHRYLYDLAAESNQLNACLEMENSFIRKNPNLTKRALKRNFHDLHENTVEAVLHHQFRSQWLTFKDDPRGPYQPLNDPSLRLPFLPRNDDWVVAAEEGSLDNVDGWNYSYTCDSMKTMIVNYKGDELVEGGTLFEYIDNYRFRILARIHKNKQN